MTRNRTEINESMCANWKCKVHKNKQNSRMSTTANGNQSTMKANEKWATEKEEADRSRNRKNNKLFANETKRTTGQTEWNELKHVNNKAETTKRRKKKSKWKSKKKETERKICERITFWLPTIGIYELRSCVVDMEINCELTVEGKRRKLKQRKK